MSERRHTSDLTDTGKLRAIAEKAADVVVNRKRESSTSETEMENAILVHERDCPWPVRFETRLAQMEQQQQEQAAAINRFLGAQAAYRWIVPVVTGVLSSTAAVALVNWMIYHR